MFVMPASRADARPISFTVLWRGSKHWTVFSWTEKRFWCAQKCMLSWATHHWRRCFNLRAGPNMNACSWKEHWYSSSGTNYLTIAYYWSCLFVCLQIYTRLLERTSYSLSDFLHLAQLGYLNKSFIWPWGLLNVCLKNFVHQRNIMFKVLRFSWAASEQCFAARASI